MSSDDARVKHVLAELAARDRQEKLARYALFARTLACLLLGLAASRVADAHDWPTLALISVAFALIVFTAVVP